MGWGRLPSWGASSSWSRPRSTSACSSSPVRTVRLSLRALVFRLNGLRDLGQLGQHVHRLLRILRRSQLRARSLEPVEQLLRSLQRLLRAHAASSLATRPSIPFTSLPASSEPQRFASVPASPLATSPDTPPDSIAPIPI